VIPWPNYRRALPSAAPALQRSKTRSSTRPFLCTGSRDCSSGTCRTIFQDISGWSIRSPATSAQQPSQSSSAAGTTTKQTPKQTQKQLIWQTRPCFDCYKADGEEGEEGEDEGAEGEEEHEEEGKGEEEGKEDEEEDEEGEEEHEEEGKGEEEGKEDKDHNAGLN